MNLSKRTKWTVASLALIAIATAAAAYFMLSTTPSPEEAHQILTKEEPTSKKVVITEFADFNCRFCAEFALAYYPRLKEDFLKNPNVEFHFRHYPFLHDTSWQAAHAYECARDQGVHGDFHGMTFAQHLRDQGPDFSPEGLTQIARISGADIRTFDNCLARLRPLSAGKMDDMRVRNS